MTEREVRRKREEEEEDCNWKKKDKDGEKYIQTNKKKVTEKK